MAEAVEGNGKNPPVIPTEAELAPVTGHGTSQAPDADDDLKGILPAALQDSLAKDFPANLVDPHGILNAPATLPGWLGAPYRGNSVPMIREGVEKETPKIGHKYHIEILDLSKEKHLERYTQICQICANGFGTISFEDRQYDKQMKNWRVLLRWAERISFLQKVR